jgi:hypothetical protein
VVGGDNCEAIAESHQVSTGALIAVNSLRMVSTLRKYSMCVKCCSNEDHHRIVRISLLARYVILYSFKIVIRS